MGQGGRLRGSRLGQEGTAAPASTPCLKALREGDTLVVWKLDRPRPRPASPGQRRAGTDGARRRPAGPGRARAPRSTRRTCGRPALVFGIFAALAEFERELIRERTLAGLEAARARGRKGRPGSSLSPRRRFASPQAAMKSRDTSVAELAAEAPRQAGHAVPLRRAERGNCAANGKRGPQRLGH